jgi:hypothetical protein
MQENWRWRKKNAEHSVVFVSASFALFLDCIADAKSHGFEISRDDFRLIHDAI